MTLWLNYKNKFSQILIFLFIINQLHFNYYFIGKNVPLNPKENKLKPMEKRKNILDDNIEFLNYNIESLNYSIEYEVKFINYNTENYKINQINHKNTNSLTEKIELLIAEKKKLQIQEKIFIEKMKELNQIQTNLEESLKQNYRFYGENQQEIKIIKKYIMENIMEKDKYYRGIKIFKEEIPKFTKEILKTLQQKLPQEELENLIVK